jgi:hypothetical protein
MLGAVLLAALVGVVSFNAGVSRGLAVAAPRGEGGAGTVPPP